jgi:hypothetical protein
LIKQIQAAAPKDQAGTILATHYQLALLQEVTETNRRGAGRPSWLDAPAPLDAPPDVLPGRYVLRFLRAAAAEQHQELSRTEIILMLPVATPPPSSAPARTPAPAPAPAPAQDPVGRIIDGALEIAGLNAEAKVGVLGDLRADRAQLLAELDKERTYSAGLRERLDKVSEEKINLVALIVERSQDLAKHMAALPQPPGEPSYIGVIREIMKGLEPFAPGVNAKLGAALPAPTPPPLPAHATLQVSDRARELTKELLGQRAQIAEALHPALQELAQELGVPVPAAAAPAPGTPEPALGGGGQAPPPAAQAAQEVVGAVRTAETPEQAIKEALAGFGAAELLQMGTRLQDPEYRASLIRPALRKMGEIIEASP